MSFSPPGPAPATATNDTVYHLRRPDLAEARAALQRLYTHQTATIWQAMLTRAGLTGKETDDASFDRLLTAMTATDPVMGLCARSLRIRATTYTYLTAAHTLISDAE